MESGKTALMNQLMILVNVFYSVGYTGAVW